MKSADFPEPKTPDLQEELWANTQEAVPVPYLAGMRMIGVKYLTPAVSIQVVKEKVSGKKGGK
jgi:hypothetical protein